MSTIIKFDLEELKKLANDKHSCVFEKKTTQNLALQPWCLGNLKESIKNLLDYKIGKYDKEFDGILLSYKNLRIVQNVGTIRNDNADIYFQVQADYFIFRPVVGATLTGIVNKKSTTHLGILVHRVFNVVIPRPTEKPGSMWVGSNIHEGQEVTFQIVVLDLYGALPYIRGELDESCVKTSSDGDDDDDSETKIVHPINVSYVDFDKTKPYNQKQIGDGLAQTDSKSTPRSPLTKTSPAKQIGDGLAQTNSKSIPRSHLTKTSPAGKESYHDKSGPVEMKNGDSQNNIGEKSKIKKQSRACEPNQKLETNPKPNKKQKRDLQD